MGNCVFTTTTPLNVSYFNCNTNLVLCLLGSGTTTSFSNYSTSTYNSPCVGLESSLSNP